MKTVEKKDGSVVRLSNEEAEKAVQSGKGKYVPKSKWKDAARQPQNHENHLPLELHTPAKKNIFDVE